MNFQIFAIVVYILGAPLLGRIRRDWPVVLWMNGGALALLFVLT